ncbi:helix-hairpin-helix domain-containing protein [Methanobacterium oryzae]|uniref:helix-hairpin-helix domain-containing protein n=1 Tax=Methanobacterium oryzae TaxID=69540 RepID=UPI003D241F45
MDKYPEIFLKLKIKKEIILDELWELTQNYLDKHINENTECLEQLELLKELENTDEFKILLDQLEMTKDSLNCLYVDFLDTTCESSLKKDKIIALKGKFQDEIRTHEIVRAVDCSKSYAKQFYLFDGEVLEKEKRTSLSSKKKEAILKRDNYSCVVCGEVESLEIHHIMAIMGSSIMELHDHDNLATLCKDCHYLAHNGNYHRGLAYENIEGFWEWTKHTEKTKIWFILKDIHGVGSKITENIYQRFKTIEALENASIKSLSKVNQVNISLAKRIKVTLESRAK